MKLSEFALTALKNFATINESIVLRQGSSIRTITEAESIYAEAEVEDVFPGTFGIHDLSNFIGNIQTLDNPDLEFQNAADIKYVELRSGQFSVTYHGHIPDLLITPPPGKRVKLDNPDVSLDLSKDTLQKLLKLSAMNSLPNLSISGKDGMLVVWTHDHSTPDSNTSKYEVGPYDGENFTATFKVENLKMLLDDYVVDIKKGFFARFASKNRKLNYFIALEKVKNGSN